MCRGHHGRAHWHGGQAHPFARPWGGAPANVAEYDDRYELELFAPGLSRADFTLQLADKTLTIRADKKQAEGEGEWLRREYRPGGFERSFTLNEKIDTEAITAAYTEGVLTVTLPKYAEQVTRRRNLDLV